ncbi:MAG: carboxypeptidase-like regulatory domain-containing protein [Bacteroidetes bacterium]|nr:carboxypeptidase-like regulatory domain-containing protein [Bacteroidota bacterium]
MKSTKQLFTFLAVLMAFVLALQVNAQEFIKGKVIDSDKKGVSFANIVLTSNYKGTTTNLYGDFELKFSSNQVNDTIRITAVGFEPLFIRVNQYVGKEAILTMKKAQFNLDKVTIQAKSLFYYTILKRAANKAQNNYINGSLLSAAYYRSKRVENNSTTSERQAALNIYDAKGYDKQHVKTAFADIGYAFTQVKRNFEVASLLSGSTNLDEILEFDIVRTPHNILHTDTTHFIDNFNVKLEKVIEQNKEKIWVISYKCLQPNLALTGDYYVSSYKGKIYINQKDYAVLKNELEVEATNYSNLGRSVYADAKTQERKAVSIQYKVTTNYEKQGKYYVLKSISYARNNKWKDNNSGRMVLETTTTDLMINSTNTNNPKPIKERQYFEEIPFDAAFWEKYNFIKDE